MFYWFVKYVFAIFVIGFVLAGLPCWISNE
jgi:hypothetical protein